MGRRGSRSVVERGIYLDPGGYEVVARLKSATKSQRFPPGTSIRTLRGALAHLRVELEHTAAQRAITAGSLTAAITTYCTTLGTPLDRWADTAERGAFRSWIAAFGDCERASITTADCAAAFARWTLTYSAQALYYRRLVLIKLWRVLDGPEAICPAASITITRPRGSRPVWVDDPTILRVYASLVARRTPLAPEARKVPYRKVVDRHWDLKTPARFLVLATTGQRPAQLKRAQPADVVLYDPPPATGPAGLWWVRAAKGGEPIPVYLNAEQAEAWRRFLAANAWGPYNSRSFAATIRRHGWPAGVRIYNLRHAVGLTLSERGIDLSDIQSHFGHTDVRTTRTYYVPQLHSRLQGLSATLAGRFPSIVPAPAAADPPDPPPPSKMQVADTTIDRRAEG